MTRLATVLLVTMALGCAGPSQSAQAQPTVAPAAEPARSETLTPEDVVNLRQVTDVALSPDTKTIAYVVRTPRGPDEGPGKTRNVIWLVPRAGGEPRRFTSPRLSSWAPSWSPDGRWLAFLSQREAGHTQVHRMPVAGGESEPVTRAPSSVSAFRWSPDGTRLGYLTARIATAEEQADIDAGRDWALGDVHGTHRRLWTIDVQSGLGRPITDRALHIERFEWSPDGSKFAVVASERADVDATMMYSDVYVVPSTGGSAVKLADHDGKLGALAWSPAGDFVAFFGAVDLNDPTSGVLHVAPASGGPTKQLTADYLGTGLWMRWVAKSRILVLANHGADTAVLSVDPASGKRKVALQGGPVCSRVDVDAQGRTLVCAGATSKHPREVFVGLLGRGKPRRITHDNPWLDQKKLGEQSVIRWKAADGLEVEGVLTKPVGYEAGRRYPLAVLVHGGPEGVSHDGWNTRSGYPAQLFAARGYVVLEPNYRGSQGRGVEFGKADQGDLGGKEFEDVLAGIGHLAAEGIVDRDRVGMGGWSYGGYFSGLAATKYSEHFKAAMVGAAITDWVSFTGTTEIEHENSLVHWNLWPWENFELAWDRSPVAHAAKSKTATLIVHGADDSRVPPEQATELYRALRHFKVPTQLVMYPREGHGLRERAHQLDFQHRWLDWFDSHVKG